MRNEEHVVGIICSECGARIPEKMIVVVGHSEYEGIDVMEFRCPYCGAETSDLQSSYWVKEIPVTYNKSRDRCDLH